MSIISAARELFSHRISSKAFQGDVYASSIASLQPNKVALSNSPVALMQLDQGTAYACNRKIAQFLSQCPVHVYAATPAGGAGKLLCPHRRLGRKDMRIQHDSQDVVELTEHPLIDLLARPYETISWSAWVQVVSTYLGILGNAYVEILRDSSGTITGLRPLLSEYMWLHTDNDGHILRYEYTPSSQQFLSKSYSPDQIWHIQSPSAGSTVAGRGWMEGVQPAIRLEIDMLSSLISLSNNMGVPSALVTMHGKAGTKEQAEETAKEFQRRFAALRRGKPMVAFSENDQNKITVDRLGMSPKECAYIEHYPILRSQICAASGVPEDLICSENSNRASSVTAMATFISYTIVPQLNNLLDQFTHRIASEYDQNIFLGYESQEILKNDPDEQSKVLERLVKCGMLTRNEAREALGYEPHPEGYKLVTQGGKVSEADASTSASEPGAKA